VKRIEKAIYLNLNPHHGLKNDARMCRRCPIYMLLALLHII